MRTEESSNRFTRKPNTPIPVSIPNPLVGFPLQRDLADRSYAHELVEVATLLLPGLPLCR
jgi:hypothetical protein